MDILPLFVQNVIQVVMKLFVQYATKLLTVMGRLVNDSIVVLAVVIMVTVLMSVHSRTMKMILNIVGEVAMIEK